jgi:exodeoxyribonuclease VII small subunit
MKELKFEEAMKKLEEIVQKLEEGNLPLEKSLELFEEGMKLSKFCSKKLEEAQTKIEVLTKTAEGKVELKPMKKEEGAGGEEKDKNTLF